MKLTGARWSSAARCPLMGALSALDAPEADPGIQAERWRARGKLFEEYVVRQLIAKHGDKNVRRQVVIPWGLGWEGHADALISARDGNVLVEVVSTTSPASQLDAKLLQLRGYWHHGEKAGIQVDSGVLYQIDPSDLRGETAMPVVLHDGHRAVIDQLTAQVVRAAEGGPLPACCKTSPTECHYNFCPYTEQVWADWEQPEADELEPTPELVEDLRHLMSLKESASDLTARGKRLADQAKDLQAKLAAAHALPVGKFNVGGLAVTRTIVKGGSETLSVTDARKAGVWPDALDEMLGEFVSIKSGYEKWKVDRIHDRPLVTADSFGEEAPF